MEHIQRRKTERHGGIHRQHTAARRALFSAEPRGRRRHRNDKYRHKAAAQQADAPPCESVGHQVHDLGEFGLPADAKQLLNSAHQHRAVAHAAAAHRTADGGVGVHRRAVAPPQQKHRQHRHRQQHRPAQMPEPLPRAARQLIHKQDEHRDEAIGKGDVLGHGQQRQRGRCRQRSCSEIYTQRAAEQHGKGQVRHGIGVHRAGCARRDRAEKVRQQHAAAKQQHRRRPFFAGQARRGTNTGQRQTVQRSKALPLGKFRGQSQIKIRDEAGGGIGLVRSQIDRVGSIKHAGLLEHFGCKAPGGKLIPLGKHGLVHRKQDPEQRGARQKQHKPRTLQRRKAAVSSGFHGQQAANRQQQRQTQPQRAGQHAQTAANQQHHRHTAQRGQRQQRGLHPGSGGERSAKAPQQGENQQSPNG